MNPLQPTTLDQAIPSPVSGSLFGEVEYSVNKFGESVTQSVPFSLVENILYIALFVFSTFFLFLIAYCSVRMFEIRKKEQEHLQHEIEEYAHHQAEKAKKKEGESPKNERWNNVLTHLSSSNPAEWKLAIIEADSMLESLMTQLGFRGESLGEKLKLIDRDKFPSIGPAWEVHLVRNKIAHEGSKFNISEREVKRIIALYEQIFKEFNYI